MSLFRKILMSLMVISGIGSSISAGTFASFNGSATNQTSTFATGSLVLDRDFDGTSCFSVGAGTNTDDNDNAACDEFVDENRVKLGDSFTYQLTLRNVGTLPGTLSFGLIDVDAGAGTLYCESMQNDVLNWTAGTGNMCQNTSITIQEHLADTFASPTSTCAFPVNAGAACSATTAGTLTANASAPHPINAATVGLPNVAAPQTLGAIGAGAERYFLITFTLLSGSSNQLQGRRAEFGLSWSLAQ